MRLQYRHGLSILGLVLGLAHMVCAQVSVAPSPVAKQQFFGANGAPLASGCLQTYITGTSTPLATYQDSTGTSLNPNPIILDSGGFANIWLSNATYRFVLVSAGGVSCATGTTQYTIDGISAWTVVNTPANLFLLGATSDPGGTAGELAYRTDIPCFRAFTTFWDCLISLTATQTLTNKTLSAPIINNATGATLISPSIAGLTSGGVAVATGNPTNFENFTNGGAGTVLNGLAKLVPLGAGTVAVSTVTSDTGGVIGIVVAGAGTSGINIVQRRGQVLCAFDGSTTVDDYVQISTTAGNNCHDTGQTTYPTSGGQVVGRVLGTNAGAGTYLMDLFPSEIRAGGLGAQIGCTNFTPVTVTNLNTVQNLLSCTIPANTLSQGSLLLVNLTGLQSTASGDTLTISVTLGGGTACATTQTQGVSTNSPFDWTGKFAVLTAGAGGTANWSCETFGITGNAPVGPNGPVGTPTIAVNTTVSNLLQVTVQMSVANAGNTTIGQMLKAVVF
jgi:hypothetical protein